MELLIFVRIKTTRSYNERQGENEQKCLRNYPVDIILVEALNRKDVKRKNQRENKNLTNPRTFTAKPALKQTKNKKTDKK